MFDDLNDLYQQVILDHCKKPRSFHEMPKSSFLRIATAGLVGTCLFLMHSLPVEAQKGANVLTIQATPKTSATHSATPNSISDEEKIETRTAAIWKLVDNGSVRNDAARWKEFEDGARQLIKDFPDRAGGYYLMMYLMERNAYEDQPKVRGLANEIIDGSAPERLKLWAKGFLNRVGGIGKPVTI